MESIIDAELAIPAGAADEPVVVDVVPTQRDWHAAYRISVARCMGLAPVDAPKSLAAKIACRVESFVPMTIAAATLIVLVLATRRPELAYGELAWITSWAPMAYMIAFWTALMRPSVRVGLIDASIRKAFARSFPDYPAQGSPIQLRLGSSTINVAGLGRSLQIVKSDGVTAFETNDAFTLILNDILVPVPKSGLAPGLTESIRAKLSPWGLQMWPKGPASVARVRVVVGAMVVLGAVLYALQQNSLRPPPASPIPAIRIRPAGHVVRIKEERGQVASETYSVQLEDGSLDEHMTGYYTVPTARGHYHVGRYGIGYLARPPHLERQLYNDPVKAVVVPSPNAVVSSLPGAGVLIAWTRTLNGGGFESCAIHTTYRDPVPDKKKLSNYRRHATLQFCSGTLDQAELAIWLDTAAEAFDTDFVARTRP